MRRRIFLLATCFAPFVRAAKKTPAKAPEVELMESAAKVEDGNLVLDGRLKNVSERPIRKLTIIYEILDSDTKVLTRQKGQIEEEQLEPGEEAGFHSQIVYPARAISVRLSFEDGGERELRTAKTVPFPIE